MSRTLDSDATGRGSWQVLELSCEVIPLVEVVLASPEGKWREGAKINPVKGFFESCLQVAENRVFL